MVLPLKNAVQPYSWGSSTAIPELFGIHDPSNGPMAEIWMGAHPKAPSEVTVNDQTISLDRYIAADPIGTLGVAAVDRFGETLPFLFKILAAAEPLSIQAHPSRAQARSGYSREEAAGISLAAPNRNYRDDNHKPELIYALTPFWGLRGFRSPSEIRAAFESLGVRSSGYLPMPSADDELPLFFRSLMTLSESDRAELVDSARRVAAEFWPEVDRFPDPGGGQRGGGERLHDRPQEARARQCRDSVCQDRLFRLRR